jgi:YbbR domain-containing protein
MPIQNIILRNFWLKFFSVALATVIWLSIHYGIQNESLSRLSANRLLAQEYIRVPVTVVKAPGDRRVFKIAPREVVVIIMGDEAALRSASNRDFKVMLDLTEFHSQQPEPVELRSEAPADVTVEEISPSTVTVEEVPR